MTLALWPLAAWGGTISGVVKANDKSIEGATVVIYDQRLAYASTQTTLGGFFTIGDVPDNPYRIRVLPPADQNLVEQWHGADLELCDGTVYPLGAQADVTITLLEGGVEVRDMMG